MRRSYEHSRRNGPVKLIYVSPESRALLAPETLDEQLTAKMLRDSAKDLLRKIDADGPRSGGFSQDIRHARR